MAYQSIGRGSSANDGTGDDLRTGAGKINANFVEVYTKLGDGSTLTSDDVVLADASQTLTNKNITGTFTGNITGDVTGNVTGNVTGDLTGDVTGDVTGNVTGNVTGDLTGDVTGNVTGNLTGNVTGDVTGDLTGALIGNVTGNVTGNLTGDVTGDVTGNLTGNVTGNVTGDVTGDLTGDVTGNVTGQVNGRVGGTTPAAGSFTEVDLSSSLQLAVFADTTARDAAFDTPTAGMVVFVTDGDGGGTAQFQGYDGTSWVSLN